MKFHCQICEREIKAGLGVIAHHGYQRPGWGYQTASCGGARKLPYEASCEAIPPVIAAIEQWVEGQKAALTKLKAEPPRGIEVGENKISFGNRMRWYTVLRPEGFSAEEGLGKYSYRFREYGDRFRAKVFGYQQHIRTGGWEIRRLEERLEAWVEVPGAKEALAAGKGAKT